MNRRLITIFGGSGFIGRHVVQRVAADGWIVRVAVRDPVAAAFLQPLGEAGQIVARVADVADAATVETAVEGADVVVNLVGILYERGRRTFQRVHVDGAANVARAAKAAGTSRLVQMSAIGADAHSPAAYGRTKKGGEDAAQAGFPGTTVVRPSVVFGPEDDFFNRFAAMARILPALPVFETAFQPVYVGDVADAVKAIIDDPATVGKTYELGGPRVIRFRELMELVLSETRRRRLLLPVPLAIAEFEAWFLEKLPVPPLTRDQVKLLQRDNVVSADALTLADLGLQPTAVEAILPTYLHRYRPPLWSRRRTG
ncbi:MAG: complex I NDUFA9 subunit family protein [Rhodospirillales bacterium]